MLYIEPEMIIVEFDEEVATDITISSNPAGEGSGDEMEVSI